MLNQNIGSAPDNYKNGKTVVTPMTQETLERLPNLRAYRCPKLGENYIYADPTHSSWQGSTKSTIEYLAKLRFEKQDISQVPFYRRVKDPSEYPDAPYFHISDFKWRNEIKNYKSGPKHVLSFDPMLVKEKGEQQTERRHTLREGNQALRRLYMEGHEDSSIHCPIIKLNIDTQVKHGVVIHNLIDAHHIVCCDGESIQKGDQDPGKLNTSVDLFIPNASSRAVIEDLMRTILVSRTGHQLIHYWRNSDVTWYKQNGYKLPWALRNKTNYGKWVRRLRQIGYHSFPSYAEWMQTLTLEYHGY